MTQDLHFTILVKAFTNHILVKSTYFTNHIEWIKQKIIMVLKPADKYQIIQQSHKFKNILIDDFQHHPFFC